MAVKSEHWLGLHRYSWKIGQVVATVNSPNMCAFHRHCSKSSDQSINFIKIASKLPKSYAKQGAKAATELTTKFEISVDGFIMKNKKVTEINASELIDFLATNRKTSLTAESIKEVAEDISALNIRMRGRAKQVIKDATEVATAERGIKTVHGDQRKKDMKEKNTKIALEKVDKSIKTKRKTKKAEEIEKDGKEESPNPLADELKTAPKANALKITESCQATHSKLTSIDGQDTKETSKRLVPLDKDMITTNQNTEDMIIYERANSTESKVVRRSKKRKDMVISEEKIHPKKNKPKSTVYELELRATEPEKMKKLIGYDQVIHNNKLLIKYKNTTVVNRENKDKSAKQDSHSCKQKEPSTSVQNGLDKNKTNEFLKIDESSMEGIRGISIPLALECPGITSMKHNENIAKSSMVNDKMEIPPAEIEGKQNEMRKAKGQERIDKECQIEEKVSTAAKNNIFQSKDQNLKTQETSKKTDINANIRNKEMEEATIKDESHYVNKINEITEESATKVYVDKAITEESLKEDIQNAEIEDSLKEKNTEENNNANEMEECVATSRTASTLHKNMTKEKHIEPHTDLLGPSTIAEERQCSLGKRNMKTEVKSQISVDTKVRKVDMKPGSGGLSPKDLIPKARMHENAIASKDPMNKKQDYQKIDTRNIGVVILASLGVSLYILNTSFYEQSINKEKNEMNVESEECIDGDLETNTKEKENIQHRKYFDIVDESKIIEDVKEEETNENDDPDTKVSNRLNEDVNQGNTDMTLTIEKGKGLSEMQSGIEPSHINEDLKACGRP